MKLSVVGLLNSVTYKSECTMFCPVTGISTKIQTEYYEDSILNESFSFKSSFHDYNTCNEVKKETLKNLTNNQLAGILLVCYKHFDLIQSKDCIEVQNSIIASASSNIIIDLIIVSRLFTVKNAVHIPGLNIEFKSQQNVKNSNEMLVEEFKRISESLKSVSNKNIVKFSYDENSDSAMERVYNVAYNTISKSSKNAIAKNEVKAAKDKASKAIEFLKLILIDNGYEKLYKAYKACLVGSSAISMDNNVRDKFYLRLSQANMELGETFNASINDCIQYLRKTNAARAKAEASALSTDIDSFSFTPISTINEEVSSETNIPANTVEFSTRKLSLKERVAIKRAGG